MGVGVVVTSEVEDSVASAEKGPVASAAIAVVLGKEALSVRKLPALDEVMTPEELVEAAKSERLDDVETLEELVDAAKLEELDNVDVWKALDDPVASKETVDKGVATAVAEEYVPEVDVYGLAASAET